MSSDMVGTKYSRYVGRVGALAVALGVGFAVATSPGVAWADTPSDGNAAADPRPEATPPADTGAPAVEGDTSSTPSRSTPEEATDGPRPGSTTGQPSSEVTQVSEIAPGVVVRSSGGALTSGESPRDEPSKDERPKDDPPTPTVPDPVVPAAPTPEQASPRHDPAQDRPLVDPPEPPAPQQIQLQRTGTAHTDDEVAPTANPRRQAASVVTSSDVTERDVTASVIAPSTTRAALAPPPPTNVIQALVAIPITFINAAANLVTGVLQALFVPAPGAPPESPLVWAVLAFVRRQLTSTFANSTPTLDPQQTSQDLGTGAITGDLNAADPDGDALTFAVPASGTGAPAHGAVTIDAVDRTWTYTPEVGYTGPDSFTITASDAGGFHLHAPGQTHDVTKTVNVTVISGGEDRPPVVTPPTPPGTPDATSGAVTGSIGVVDPDGDPLTFTFTDDGQPRYGTVEIDPVTGVYTYAPNQAGRLRSALGLGNTDSFTVVVTQGGAAPATFARTASRAAAADDGFSETVTITDIPIAGATLAVDGQPIAVGGGPAGIVVTDRYAYVVNSQNSTVSVIDIATNTVVGTPITVGSTPVLAAGGPGRVYVVNAFSGNVSVIDTATNTVDGAPIPLAAGSSSPALSPDGTRLFVTNSSSGGVFVVDTATKTVIDADPSTPQIDPIIVGDPPLANGMDHYVPNGGIAFSEDGSRVYVTRQHLVAMNGSYVAGSGDVVTLGNDPSDPATYLKPIGNPIALTGKVPAAAAVAGNRLYVGTFNTTDAGPVNGTFPNGTLMVVDIDPDSATFNQVLDGIAVGPLPLNIAVSPDESLGYTVNLGAGTVSVIDLLANEKIYELHYASGPVVVGAPSIIAISPDGTKLYVTNYSRNDVTAVTIT